MIEVKKFSGIWNSDQAISEVAPNEHIDALNIIFRGEGNNKRVENVLGNVVIANADLPATGTNRHHGSFYDDVRQRLYWFNWNSEGKHGFYYYDLKSKVIVPVLICFTDSEGDILQFDLDRPIASINILYGDDDIIYFVDSLKRPTYINVNKVINAEYGQIKRAFLDVAKAPAIMPPKVVYENDTTVTINNLKNSLFQFRYRPVFLNNEKSVWSSASIVPLPNVNLDASYTSSTSENARIAVYIETGDIDVQEIELAVKVFTNNNTSDWLKIKSLNKTDLSIADNSIYRFVFYNDEIYTPIPTEGVNLAVQELQLQDYVPRETNAQELLNGNVIIYGAIKEGYDKVAVSLSSTTSRATNYYNQYNGLLFFATQISATQIKLYLTGTGTNDGSGNPTTLNNSLTKFTVRAKRDTGANRTFEYTNTTATTLVTDILDDIVTQAALQGFTEASRTTNTLTLNHTENIILSDAYYSYVSGDAIPEVRFAFAPDARYSFGVVYYDDKGRTNGVFNSVQWSVNIPSFNHAGGAINELPKVTLTISHRPPLWAAYCHVVRTDDNTYGKRTTWVSAEATADTTGVGSFTSTRYAYIDIGNMALYNEQLKSATGSVGYEFVQGDRIRFMGRFPTSASLTLFDAAKDYEILGVKVDPFVNGKKYTGTYLQIEYPDGDISGDFKFDGAEGFRNYYILLYNYRKRLDDEKTLFYEFGKQYGIGNAGTGTAYHFGSEVMQTADLATPAQISVVDGDYFYRTRSVPNGEAYDGEDQTFDFNNNPFFLNATVPVTVENAPIVSVMGTINNQTFQYAELTAPDYPDAADTDCVYSNTTAGTVKLHVQCQYSFDADADVYGKLLLKLVNNPIPLAAVILQDLMQPAFVDGDLDDTTGVIDIYVDTPTGTKAFLIVNKSVDCDMRVVIWDFIVTPMTVSKIPIFEKTYSDNYLIQVPSSGRALVVDDDARETYNSTLRRWGMAYQQGTNINETNRFYPVNFDEKDKSKGDIQRLAVYGDMLLTLQNRGVASDGIYKRFISDSGGNNSLVVSASIITANNGIYYKGQQGIGEQYTSLVRSTAALYFVDPILGEQVRISANGMDSISELWHGKYFIKSKLTPYNRSWTRADGGLARIHGYFDYAENQCVCVLEGGENEDDEIEDYTFAFQERTRENPSYTSPYSFHPEGVICAQDVTFSWKNGLLYIHNSTTTCNFYGTQYDAFITVPFNSNIFQKKLFQSISQYGSRVWPCTEIYTDDESYVGQRQESNLVASDFRLVTGKYQAALMRDVNSIGGVANGEKLRGSIIVLKFHIVNASAFAYLAIIEVLFNQKQLTPR